MNPHPIRSIAGLRFGDHVGFLYQTEAEHRAIISQYIRDGLTRGQKVFYIADTHTADIILGYLRAERTAIDSYLDRGQLVIASPEDTFTSGGAFDPDRMVALVRQEIERAILEGYAGIRGTGEMTWVLGESPGSTRLMDYEVKLNEATRGTHFISLCQYDRRRFEPEVLLDVMHTHPILIIGTDVLNNFYYVPSIKLSDHYLPSTRFKVCLENLLYRKRLEETLKKSEEQLRHSQKMEAIGRLASGVAHEFNNLVMGITGYTELLLADLAKKDPRRSDIEEILKASKKARTLIDQLLAFSRNQTLEQRELNLNDIVANLEKMLRRILGQEVEIVTLLEPSLRHTKGDPGQLEQVLMNVVLNARDAMPRGGKIAIKTENITLHEQDCAEIPESRPGRFVCVSITDTGTGMDEHTIQHIFEPFFTTKDNSTGLGLSIAYGIIKQHRGWINVIAEPERGSSFKIYLPAIAVKKELSLETERRAGTIS